jgi:hypothetical protein
MVFIAGRGKVRRTLHMPGHGREDPLPVKELKSLLVRSREEIARQSSGRDSAPVLAVSGKSDVPLFEPFRFPG